MRANVIGRVRNTSLPKTQGLLPLFEAIINSIDAIDDAGHKVEEGDIQIKILRQYPEVVTTDDDIDPLLRNPISGFEIQDNGIGFNEENYQAFNEADTQYKEQRGGKGVGRFLWLKAFNKVEVDSIFKVDGKFENRSFLFSLASSDGISNHKIIKLSKEEIRTIVRLLELNEQYETSIPRNAQTIAQRIVEHCMEYYLLSNMPEVRLYDQDLAEPIELDSVYENFVANAEKEIIKIDGHDFDVIHFLLNSPADFHHRINYCANLRVVKKVNITNKVPNLPPSLCIGDDNFLCKYSGYVSSEFFNEHVNQQRTDFAILSEKNGTFTFPGELTWADIEPEVLKATRDALAPYTEPVRVEKESRIREYVDNQAPQYKHILKNHPEKLDIIQPQIPDESLDTKLYELHRQIEGDLRGRAEEYLEQGDAIFEGEGIDYTEELNKFSKFWEELNEVGKSNLSKYIVHRKLTLEFFERALQRHSTGRYTVEEAIHQLIFPIKHTSDDINYDQHNLWIIDEKLSYHQYLASDVPLTSIDVLDSDSLARPDLFIVFDHPIAVVDEEPPFNSGIVIFEFKRPMRNDYSSERNPITQVLAYVDEIKAGKVVDKNGRLVNVPQSVPFYCYIICDLTESLKNQARYAGLILTPDTGGYFGYNQDVGAYLEVINFNKLVLDAKKRKSCTV